ncbi:unnamed protein product, partial [Thlaspi arvense]
MFDLFESSFGDRTWIFIWFVFAKSAVATPEQIKTLMKVDGFTNDKAKSHFTVLGKASISTWFRNMAHKLEYSLTLNLKDLTPEKKYLKSHTHSLQVGVEETYDDDELELDSLPVKKSKIESGLDREKQEKSGLSNHIDDVKKALMKKEAAYNMLGEETLKKQLTKDHKEAQKLLEETCHEQTMESLRNELGMKGDEIETLMEKIGDIKKSRVAKHVLTEKEEAQNID